jgi:hypothetical protein
MQILHKLVYKVWPNFSLEFGGEIGYSRIYIHVSMHMAYYSSHFWCNALGKELWEMHQKFSGAKGLKSVNFVSSMLFSILAFREEN